jgi:molybdopterin-guanine dinucleotide biosynthesis protein A
VSAAVPRDGGRRGALVLAGGRSTRMGRDKATLRFGPETLLQRVVRRVAPSVEEVVVVARPGQSLPPLPAAVRRAEDDVSDQGPLRGLAAGLRAATADALFATSCDVPFLSPAVVDLLFARLGAADVAMPEADGRAQPLAAVYRRRALPAVERLLAEGRTRPVFLLDAVPSVRVPEEEIRRVDPDLATLANLNTPDLYEDALRRRGPVVRVELFETARRIAGVADLLVDAATLGEALGEAARAHPALVPSVIRDGRLAPTWRATVDGRAFVEDPATPLRDGASVLLVSALAGG